MYVKTPRPSSLPLWIQNCVISVLSWSVGSSACQEQDCSVLWTWSDVADPVEKPGGFRLNKLTTRETAQVLGKERLQLGSLQATVSCSHACLTSSVEKHLKSIPGI